MRIWHLLLAGAVLPATLALTPVPARAARSYDSCTGFIDSLPAVIGTQGTWCLRKDLSTAMNSGRAIDIRAHNVTIDCNDFEIGGLAAGPGTQSTAIYAVDRHNITVRHCNIRGFYAGVGLSGDGGGHVIEHNQFGANTHIGIYIFGPGSTVRNNQVRDTGGALPSTQLFAIGIETFEDVDILDNTVDGVFPTSDNSNYARPYGIFTGSNGSGSIRGNRVRGLVPVGSAGANGIYNYENGRIIIRNNDVAGNGLAGSGLYCSSGAGHATNNVVHGFSAGITLCTDDGNVVAP